MFAIPKTGKAKVAMKYLNLMHSDPTLVNLMLYGKEGVNYEKIDDETIRINPDANWLALHGGAWTVGNTKLQMVTEGEDPKKNELLQSFADDAEATASLGFRFIKDGVMDEVNAVSAVVKELGNPLRAGAVDPDDPEKGLEAFRKALKDAGIDKIIEEAQAQYATWKDSLK